MNPSELTDEQLNQAILEELGWKWCKMKIGSNFYRALLLSVEAPWEPTDDMNLPIDFRTFEWSPNYTGDVAAAMSLPLETNDEKRKFAIELAKIVIPDINIGTAGIVYEAAFATARQRSEAWLIAKRGE